MKICLGLLLSVTCLVSAAAAQRVEEEEIAVLAKVFNDYTREPSALGGYKAETFAFANGGAVLGRISDPSVDKATFNEIIRLISPALTRQNYVAATDPDDTDLLIYVNWGATDGLNGGSELTDGTAQAAADITGDWFGNASLMDDANRRRDRSNYSNAALLGYREAMARHVDLRAYGIHGTLYQDLVADVEEPRYFVILTAFDFKTAWDSKQLVPLWSVRYNIATRGNHFTAALPSMSQFASRFFGRDSGGLIRRLNPTGKVEMGEVQILGETAVPAQQPKRKPKDGTGVEAGS
jgi:hypothetical protein